MDHYMNPSYRAMMGHGEGAREQDEGPKAKKEEHKRAMHDKPDIHIHSHPDGHTVHIMHKDGTHEKHEHEHGDTEGIAAHIHEHLGSSDSGEETGEMGASPGGAASAY